MDPLAHLGWARYVARKVRSEFGFGRRSQEEADLESVAYLALVKKVNTFDPAAWVPLGGDAGLAFRGYAYRYLYYECRAEAERLRNGGTYHTRGKGRRPVGVHPLPPDLTDPRANGYG